MTTTISIASIQLTSSTDIDANLRIIDTAISEAAAHGAKLIVLPENACVMGRQADLAARYDEMVNHFANLARAHGVHLVAGTLPCPTRPDGSMVSANSDGESRFRQISLAFDDAGKQIGRYDKIHLFRATVDDGVGSYDEARTFEGGDTLRAVPMCIDGVTVNVGLTICFDVRFPRLMQSLRQMGADIITVPAAFTYQTGRAHWQLLLTARALDSQCLLVGSAQGGTHKIGSGSRETWGHSLIVNAYGKVLVTTDSTETGEHDYLIAYADFDKDYQQKVRQAMPIFDCHRLG